MSDNKPAPPSALAPRPTDDLAEYARQARAGSTLNAYKEDWRRFVAWCAGEGLPSLPAAPETVARYAVYLGRDHRIPGKKEDEAAGVSVRYLRRTLASINWAHAAAGIDPPPTRHEAVKAVVSGVIRKHGKPPSKRLALSPDDLGRLLAVCPTDTSTGLRDRALLIIGYLGAMRRSELVALDREHVEEVPGGLRVMIVRSKTDQQGQGEPKGLKRRDDAGDPVRALRDWLRASGITAGPLFRPIDRHGHIGEERLTDRSVADVIKRACERAGLDPLRYSGHSLRRGFATSSAQGGADGLLIRKQTRHKSDRMVAEYVEEGGLLGRHAQDYIGPIGDGRADG